MAQEQINNKARLIVFGGSSGALEALLQILPALQNNFTIPIIIVLHRGNDADTGLAEVLKSKTTLHVKEADEKDILKPGWVYIAPPDYHLLVEDDGSLSLDVSEKIYYCRPSIDVTFRSAAIAYHSMLIAVLLSGANEDGAKALGFVRELGGAAIVQSPEDARVPYMPQHAISHSAGNTVLTAEEISSLLNKMTGTEDR